MGQKVNPLGIRLGITRDWTSKWYAGKKQFPQLVHTDFRVREFLKKRLADASVSRMLIERAAKKVNITIQTARPGIVIGKKGEDIEKLRGETARLLGMPLTDVRLNIAEIRKPELDAQLVAESIAQQIEKRVMFRRAMKRAVMSTMRSGALGIKVRMSGPPERLGDRAHRVVPRRPHPAAHLPRRHRLRPGRGQHHLRRHRHQGLDLQGRGVRPGAARACRGERRAGRGRAGGSRAGCRGRASRAAGGRSGGHAASARGNGLRRAAPPRR